MAKYKIKEVKVGVRTRYQIQKKVWGFLWKTVINTMVKHPANTPFEYKRKEQAQRKIVQLEAA